MAPLDFAIIGLYLVGALAIGVAVSKRASESSDEYFLAGRSLPWWLAGTSMVATTFAADTPLAVTGLVATGGIAGNWIWWTWGVAHVVAALVFARYWRRLRLVTDAEVMERRYTGRAAAVLRVVKAAYQSIFINCLTMGWVILAMRKVSGALFPALDPLVVTFGLMAMAVLYSMLGGMRSVVLTDLLQFALAMFGALVLMIFVLRETGGVSGLVAAMHDGYPERAASMLAFIPEGDLPGLPLTLFAVLLTVAWWRQAEGGGYIVQRLGACKSPEDAERAGILFAVLHNAIRPWPWILVGLAALIVFPLDGGDCASCAAPYVCTDGVCGVDRESTYALLMVDQLPAGILGIAVASMLAAFMSTIDTHVNWGASYVVRDIWERFVEPDAEPRRLVTVGRIAVVAMGLIAAIASLGMTSIASVWLFLIMLGSGLGSVAIARWLWWRVNAQAELAGLTAASLLSLGVVLFGSAKLFGAENGLMLMELTRATQILIVALGSLAVWVPVALLTPPTAPEILDAFYRTVRPWGPGWSPVAKRCADVDTRAGYLLPLRLAAGMVAVFGTLFGLGGAILRGPAWGLGAALGLAATGWLIATARGDDFTTAGS